MKCKQRERGKKAGAGDRNVQKIAGKRKRICGKPGKITHHFDTAGSFRQPSATTSPPEGGRKDAWRKCRKGAGVCGTQKRVQKRESGRKKEPDGDTRYRGRPNAPQTSVCLRYCPAACRRAAISSSVRGRHSPRGSAGSSASGPKVMRSSVTMRLESAPAMRLI